MLYAFRCICAVYPAASFGAERIAHQAAKHSPNAFDLLSDRYSYAENPEKPADINRGWAQRRLLIRASSHEIRERVTSKKLMLKNLSQVADDMNQVYRPAGPRDDEMYDNELRSTRDIYAETLLLTDLFDDKTPRSFSTLCGVYKLNFLSGESARKYPNETIAKYALDAVARRRTRINGLKEERYGIVGYARKSPSSEPKHRRLSLLQSMNDRLKSISAVDNKYLDAFSKRVAIVAIDFAGLTTNTNDLIRWLKKNECIKVVLIDNAEAENRTYSLTKEKLLADTSLVQLFDRRSAPVRRSLEQ
ncbi:hypothetical protein BCR43DRAFT_525476 [Syncephalastrum racemosum]|uniref:Uncharacterized protein n=1 Tax=Syncephalastrum racemosum TaxID=13706 RepID=A0A1X2HAV8_SYNRA|nr:hypothetical protein BCR43DRAFT_525476 [Syncephalastrum racemosum]